MNLQKEFKMVKQVLIEQRWMFNEIQKQGKQNIKDHITVHSFSQRSVS